MTFNKISSNTFRELQLGAGTILSSFDPAHPAEPSDQDILFATTGGVTISCVPTLEDLGADVDNCPKNTAELQRITDWECTISTTALSVAPAAIQLALGSADIINGNKVAPRKKLTISDFVGELWWVGEQGANGMAAVKLSNALSTGGLSLTTTSDGKGNMSLTIKGFARLSAPDVVPMEFYSAVGTDTPSVSLDRSSASVAIGDTITLTATVYPVGSAVTWTSSNNNKATVADGVVTGAGAGMATITARITVDGTNYTDTCAITVES